MREVFISLHSDRIERVCQLCNWLNKIYSKEEENYPVNCENGKCVGKDIHHLVEDKLLVFTAIAKRWRVTIGILLFSIEIPLYICIVLIQGSGKICLAIRTMYIK
jgi:hypothetical protein